MEGEEEYEGVIEDISVKWHSLAIERLAKENPNAPELDSTSQDESIDWIVGLQSLPEAWRYAYYAASDSVRRSWNKQISFGILLVLYTYISVQ